jgi:hypothetical protein
MADIIYAYSRKQALEDGTLVDVTEVAKEAGVKHPTAVTAALWNIISTFPEKQGQSIKGRLWDTLVLFVAAARKSTTQETHFKVGYQTEGGVEEVELWGWIGPGDTEDPVITLMLEEED